MKIRSLLSTVVASFFALTLTAVPVYAQNGLNSGSGNSGSSVDSTQTTTETSSGTNRQRSGGVASTDSSSSTESEKSLDEQKKTEKQNEIKNKLDDKKLSLCKKREGKINDKMTRIVERGQKQIDVFTKIATRVEDFYVKQGNTLDTYATLVDNVNTQKTAAETALNTLKNTSVEFKCDGTDPKGAGAAFKDALRTEQQALKSYKTAVKDLIVGVKSVQPATESDGGTQQ